MKAAAQPPLILFSEVYPRFYGGQRSLWELYREFQRTGRFRLHFLHNLDGPMSDAVRGLGIPCTRIPLEGVLGRFGQELLRPSAWRLPALGFQLLRYSRRLARLIRALGAALFHSNGDRVCLTSMLAARWTRIPLVTHVRRNASMGWLDRPVFHGATHVVWVAHEVRRFFAERWRLAPDFGSVIYNGRVAPPPRTPADRRALLDEFGLPDDAFLVLKLAALKPVKDQEMLIRAAARVCAADLRPVFLLAGVDASSDGGRRGMLERMVADAGLGGRVRFLGHRDDPDRLLRGADLLANTSRFEALGGALIEAISHALPVVATDVGGTREIVLHERCGFLVSAGDDDATARHILQLLRDPALRERLGAQGRAHFAERFDVATCARQTAALFDRLIAQWAASADRRSMARGLESS